MRPAAPGAIPGVGDPVAMLRQLFQLGVGSPLGDLPSRVHFRPDTRVSDCREHPSDLIGIGARLALQMLLEQAAMAPASPLVLLQPHHLAEWDAHLLHPRGHLALECSADVAGGLSGDVRLDRGGDGHHRLSQEGAEVRLVEVLLCG